MKAWRSPVLEERQTPHLKLEAVDFEGQAPSAEEQAWKRGVFQAKHKALPNTYGCIMKPGGQTWRSPAPGVEWKAMFAWLWLQALRGTLRTEDPQPNAMWRCRLFSKHLLVEHLGQGKCDDVLEVSAHCILLNSVTKHAASGHDLDPLQTAGDSVLVMHPHNESLWQVVPWAHCPPFQATEWLGELFGCCFKQSGSSVSMLQHGLASCMRKLTKAD